MSSTSHSSGQPIQNAITNVSPLILFLLEHGLAYLQQGSDTECITCLKLACEQLSHHQLPFTSVLEKFIAECMEYQYTQQALQEVSLRFAIARAEQEARLANFVSALEMLLAKLNSTDLHASPLGNIVLARPPLPSQPSPALDVKEYLAPMATPVPAENSAVLPELSITCFGSFVVRRSGSPLELCSSRNGQAILRYLVAQPKSCASSDTLMAVLWPEEEQEIAQRKLHVAVSALRRSLNIGLPVEARRGYILCEQRMYHLNQAVAIRTDVEEFLAYYQEGRKSDERTIKNYEQACRLYTGPFLREDIYADWASLRREQLSQIYLHMCRSLTMHYIKIHHYENALRWATAILQEDRCDEIAHRQLMYLYAAMGQRSDAIKQYQLCEQLLQRELGTQPLLETREMVQKILAGEDLKQ
jgi:DNA-binding SARP family transcriptional activator